jgi:hypothetical protein
MYKHAYFLEYLIIYEHDYVQLSGYTIERLITKLFRAFNLV